MKEKHRDSGIELNILLYRKMMMRIMLLIIIEIKINSDDDLLIDRLFFWSDVFIHFRFAVEKGAAYYPQIFLEKVYYKKKIESKKMAIMELLGTRYDN